MLATTDPTRVIVMTGAVPHPIMVHHRDFPDLSADGESPAIAARNLAQDLAREIELADDEMHREPLRHALDDVRAYIDRAG